MRLAVSLFRRSQLHIKHSVSYSLAGSWADVARPGLAGRAAEPRAGVFRNTRAVLEAVPSAAALTRPCLLAADCILMRCAQTIRHNQTFRKIFRQ